MFKLNRDFFMGAALGFGAGFLAGGSRIVQDKRVKEAVKGAIKTGILGFEKLREEIVRKAETLEDMFVEAKSEVRQEQQAAADQDIHSATRTTAEATPEVRTH